MRRRRVRAGVLYRVGVISVALVICPASHVFGEEVGSPSNLLEKGQWVMGLSGGGLWKRTMHGGAKVSMYQVGHTRGYGLTNRISLYGKLGVAYVDVRDSTFANDPGSSNSFGANVFVSGQLKTILWENARKDWNWDGSLQYMYVGAPHRRKGNQVSWNEWQFATCLAKSFGPFKPYAGVKTSLVSADYTRHGQTTRHGSYRPSSIVGPFLGMDWVVGDDRNTVINLEGAYLGGLDLSLALIKKF